MRDAAGNEVHTNPLFRPAPVRPVAKAVSSNFSRAASVPEGSTPDAGGTTAVRDEATRYERPGDTRCWGTDGGSLGQCTPGTGTIPNKAA